MDSFNKFLAAVDNWVWGIPLIVLIMACGLILTIRGRGLQFRHLGKALKFMVKNEDDGEGEVSSFAALCTALSATIGTGNIVGVATAIAAGGAGALFWMIVAALLGMATKYAEGFLAIKYRTVDSEGHYLGGPFYYIERGMGKKFKWLSGLFAIFGVLAGLLGIGTITQINGITSAVNNFFTSDIAFTIGSGESANAISWATIIAGLIVTVLAALVIIGGIKRISSVSQVVVPFMAVLYILFALILVIMNITKIPDAVVTIVKSAFGLDAVAGGAIGSMMIAMQKGVARGIFSNEAGLGSAPIAAAAAQTKEPVRQGLVTMTGTFIDTIIVCTMTGLSIVISGAYLNTDLEGVEITTAAFQSGLPFPSQVSAFVLMICLIFFAFTTILGWSYYSERCLAYLTGSKKSVTVIYRWIYIAAVFIGPYLTVSAVWTIADIFNGLMALPNIVALIVLSGVMAKDSKEYFSKNKLGANVK
ncbi:MAG: alanine:cation symporter family protein [Ruminococcus sp.]|nr:alanine:cation symporter family protein [Ruminococcus sp.]